ncbi:hypothetical protein [Porphyromonas levii]|uniref:hypothetical protein n=1 Tax=Porphyromonas levii TaxID=28114 RepID=UPI000380C920|nr:hypothetical protein [Porphyromonas levii]
MIVVVFLCLYLIFWGAFFDVSQIGEIYSIIGIIFISIVGLVYLLKKYRTSIVIVFFVAYVLRLLLLFLDYSGIPIIHSGADTETFYRIAVNNISRSSGNHLYLTNYTVFLTYLFKLIGPQRLFAQYINVVLGITTLVYTYKSMRLLEVGKKGVIAAMWILALMPNQVILSSILLRESIIISTFTISMYYLLKWLREGETLSMVLSLFFIVLSSVMHSGMLGVALGFMIVFASYQRSSGKLKFSKRLIVAIPLALVFFVVLISSGIATSYLNFLLNPDSVSSTEALLDKASIESSDAGSAYLVGVNTDSIPKLLLFLPLKILYFLFSPMPWNWRGMGDIISFLLDSAIILWMFWAIYYPSSKKRPKANPSSRSIVHIIMLGVWISIAMYSLGTSTAGTAMRHRANFIPAILVCSILSSYENKSKAKKALSFPTNQKTS